MKQAQNVLLRILAPALIIAAVGAHRTASAEVVSTSDGNITVTESLAPLGVAGTYSSGGDGLIGVGGNWPTLGDTPANRATAASNYDHTWLQGDPAIIWRFAQASAEVFAIPGVDHGPIPQENLEYTIWGSNDGVNWEEGTIKAIYRDGFDTADTADGHSDDYTSLWGFGKAYTMVRATSGDHLTGGDHGFSGVEFEIDGVAQRSVPDAGSNSLLLGLGLVSLGFFRRKNA